MAPAISPQWQEKASYFVFSSGMKLKEAGQSAGLFVGVVAKDAKNNVADVAGRFRSVVKHQWSVLQKPSTRRAVQDGLISAAASTGTMLRKGVEETKGKVVVGKMKMEEVAKKTAEKSKTILTDIERRQKGVASTDVFGVPIEVTVQRQWSGKAVPRILTKCADYLVLSGLNVPYLFKAKGNVEVIQELVSLFNHDWNSSLPGNLDPVDIASLMKCYLASLPEPLATFDLDDDVRAARSSIPLLRNILKRLPNVNYMTLEYVTALLLHVCQKSPLNKMDARSLAIEVAPIIIWRNGRRPEVYKHLWSRLPKALSRKNENSAPTALTDWDTLADGEDALEASTLNPLDEGLLVDFEAIEVVQCLIEHHNAIFTDANETLWI